MENPRVEELTHYSLLTWGFTGIRVAGPRNRAHAVATLCASEGSSGDPPTGPVTSHPLTWMLFAGLSVDYTHPSLAAS